MNQEQIILKLLERIELNKPNYSKLERYYNGDHDILKNPRPTDPTKSDMKAYFNYARKMVQNTVGYLLGKPINYASKSGNKEFLDLIDYYFSNWEKEHNINLKLKSSIHGEAYEVSFIGTDGEFKCASFTPLEMVVLHDGSIDNKVLLAVRKYKLEFDINTYIEVWDNVNYSRYKLDGTFTPLEQKPHLFNRCPVRVLKNNDTSKSTFEDIMKIMDMYNTVHSLSAQEFVDFRNAYLVLKGCSISNEDAVKMKENGIIILPNQQSSAEWLTKNINGTFIQNMLTEWRNEMFIQSQQVNMNENFSSNTSGVSIRLKLQELENQSAIAEAQFEKVLKDRLEFFCQWMNKSLNKSFNPRDISIAFSRNVPVDEAAIATMVRDLADIVPLEERLSWLPRVQNPAASIKKLLQEQDGTGLVKDMLTLNDTSNGSGNGSSNG